MTIAAWTGRAVTQARAVMAQQLPAPCARRTSRHCIGTITTPDQMIVGHIRSRLAYPELTWEPSNWQIECVHCSTASNREAHAERDARFSDSAKNDRQDLLPGSLSPGSAGAVVPAGMGWDPVVLGQWSWLRPLLEVPEDASPPLAMTRPGPGVVGSYGWDAVEWIESTQRIRLRWWQRLAIVRQLEHDAAGKLDRRVMVESAPRRAGKSVRLRGVALWRLRFGQELFGEPQLVIHTGKDVAIVREIQMKAWRWAEEVMLWIVTRGNGKEALETLRGDRWLARAMHSVYGYDVALGMVDEAWAVDPAAVDEGLEPATMERPSPQLHLTSTAHRKATSLMRRRISDALAADDGETLLLWWGAGPGADPGDPGTWRAASPHWSEDRRRMIAAKYAAALAGEVDPEADDPDPMAGFEAQYLNRWSMRRPSALRGRDELLVDGEAWEAAGVAGLEVSAGAAVAVEDWFGSGAAVAVGARLDDGRIAVSGRLFGSRAEAFAWARLVADGSAQLLLGASLADCSELALVPDLELVATRGTAETRTALPVVRERLKAGTVVHDGSPDLADQIGGLLVIPGSGGLNVSTRSPRHDLARAAAWVVAELDQPAALEFFVH